MVCVDRVCRDGRQDANDAKEHVHYCPPDKVGKVAVYCGDDGSDECNDPPQLKGNERSVPPFIQRCQKSMALAYY